MAAHETSAQEREPGAGGFAVEWPFVGGDAGNTRCSAADTLTPDNLETGLIPIVERFHEVPAREAGPARRDLGRGRR